MFRKAALPLIICLSAVSNSYAQGSGLATLPLLNKKFPVNQAYDVIKRSPAPAFGFVHKVFGNEYSNLKLLINKLINNPANTTSDITVVVYVDCGPCRFPRRAKGFFSVIEGNESISSLNHKLEKGNTHILSAFNKEMEFVEKHLPIHPRVVYKLQIGLEDNYSDKAYSVLRSLASQVYSQRPDITIGRNSLHFKQSKYPTELHSYSYSDLRKLKKGDVITGDGATLLFPGEKCQGGRSTSEVRRLVLKARKMGVTLLLWRPENQGLKFCDSTASNVPVNKRKYTILNSHDLKKLLRR